MRKLALLLGLAGFAASTGAAMAQPYHHHHHYYRHHYRHYYHRPG